MSAESLLQILADGQRHSGERIAEILGVTRASVWKRAKKLRAWGLNLQAEPGRGYRLAAPIELLNRDSLAEAIRHRAEFELERIDVFTEIASTNGYLIDNPPTKADALTVCLAEYQSAGRGRRGRHWRTPLGAGLCLSLGWRFAESPPQLTALPLAVGVGARRAIRQIAGIDLRLKWPNDLVVGERKLGGILVELAAEAQGQSHVVIGVGVNIAMPDEFLAAVCDWPAGAIDLRLAQPDSSVGRHALCSMLICEIGKILENFTESGFARFADEWRQADHLQGRQVVVQRSNGQINGVAVGVDEDAALLVDVAGQGVLRIVSGDVRVRARA